MTMNVSHYMKKFGKSYYLANIFFPKRIQKDVYVLYALVREADNIIDNTMNTNQEAKAQLEKMKLEFRETYNDNEKQLTTNTSVVCLAATMYRKREIPLDRMMAFFDSMLQDTTCTRYESYKDLQQYMYWSAEVIGLMLTHMVGWQPKAHRYAKLLWEAMQYTNFLRDIKEDYRDYWRIYMPWDRLAKYRLTQDKIIEYCSGKPIDENRVWFIKSECQLVRWLYKEANKGISMLPKQVRLAVYLASKLYEAIINKIERNNGDVFTKNTNLKAWEKIWKVFITTLRYAITKKTN